MRLKKFILFILAIVLGLSFSACGNGTEPEKPPTAEEAVDFVLEVEGGRPAKILQLTDIQIIDSDQMRTPNRLNEWSIEGWKPEHISELAFEPMRQTVEKVNPDLIVLSGDNVYGEFDDTGTSLIALIAEMDSYKTPWTFTFGNHDNETYKGVAWTVAQYQKSEYCLFTRGDIENVPGNGNFNIGIMQNGIITEVVWLMDSNGHTDSDRDQNMFSTVGLFEAQLEWFKSKAEKLVAYGGGKNISSIGFFHHPMRAFGDGMQKYGYVSTDNGFFNEDGDYGEFAPITIPENTDGDYGVLKYDGGLIDSEYEFHALLKKYGAEGWFFGHEHENNSSVKFEGIRYSYGLKASFYDSYTLGQVGGTAIEVGGIGGLRCENVYYVKPQ